MKRAERSLARDASLLLAAIVVAWGIWYWVRAAGDAGGYAGIDYSLYMNIARRWLEGGPLFETYQLAGPYPVGGALYPPVALYLFVPFTFLPAVLWWAVPLGITGWALWRVRPAAWTWPLIAMCVAFPTTGLKILTGNPVMWVLAAVALGTVWSWPFVLAIVKPSLLPFALLGARSRSWWVALGVLALVSLPLGGLWLDWVHATLNAQGAGLFYSWQEVPMLLVPVVAALGRHGRTARSALMPIAG
jgi:hypothetical protein